MPTPTYIPLADVTLVSDSDYIELTDIVQDYKDLILEFEGGGAALTAILLRFNDDGNANYHRTYMYGTGSSSGAAVDRDQTSVRLGITSTTVTGAFIAQIMDYSSTTNHKPGLFRFHYPSSGAQAVQAGAFRWASTAAITSITVLGNSDKLAAGTTVRLFGIAG